MSKYRQAKWNEPLLFEMSVKDRVSHKLPQVDRDIRKVTGSIESMIPQEMIRAEPPSLPEVSELQIVRHFTRLSQMNFSVSSGTYPLGSCTMKYNPVI
ncbi:MAG: aminomethyl-transferring glycine dehydrogenase subunit GcvPB, partial [Candidatus Sifarchaeia archaeon]